jgi:hypothetical protein
MIDEEFDNPAKVREMDASCMERRQDSERASGKQQGRISHTGGAGKWFLVSGPQASTPLHSTHVINTRYFILWLCYVEKYFSL